MVAEIRTLLTRIQTEKISMKETLSQTIEHLMELGTTILDPFLMNNTKMEASTRKKRRQNSYLLPLELIPTLLATLDVLYDNMQKDNSFWIGEQGVAKTEDDATVNGDADIMMQYSPEALAKHEELDTIYARPSDTLLLSMFALHLNDENSECSMMPSLQRTMRADASLHMLSLAMDDVGMSRMSTSLPSNEGLTCWDCLQFALNDVIQANLVCYAGDNESNARMAGEEAKQQIIKDAISDQGLHIIPVSDYPGLMRCVFRMVTTKSNPNNSGWEGILLRLYHATAVATSKALLQSVHQHKHSVGAEQLTMLSTVESHVLLPSCTGASVSTIKSILETCSHECCASCKQYSEQMRGGNNLRSCEKDVVPTWAAAGLVLLMIRARASSTYHSMAQVTFGPRAVFRMASELVCKNENQGVRSGSSNDEVSYATKVLLHFACIESDICLACREDNMNHGSDNAYDVLKSTYYAGNERFLHRYKPSNSYTHQVGLQTLSSYSNLVRASLNHGTLDNTRRIQLNSSVADTAGAWINVANTLLDENKTYDFDGAAMAIVIILVIFFEIPSSRDDIVRSVYDRIVNMTPKSGSKDGRQNEETCFVLISTLAWSLVAGCEKQFDVDVVHRSKAGGKSNDTFASSVLGPLCNLLSKSATSSYQDVHGALPGTSNGSPRLSHWALHQLAHALAPVSAGRDVLLAMAQKNLRMLTISSSHSYSTSHAFTFFESIPSTPAAANDAVFLAVDCLCLLVQKCHPTKSSADDCSQAALGILTDLISLCSSSYTTSRVNLNVISWMLGELNKSARLDKLAIWSSQRLLRACVVGLMKLMSFTKTEYGDSPILLPGRFFSAIYSSPHIRPKPPSNGQLTIRQRYNIPGMFRLAFSLYDAIGRSNNNIDSELVESVPELHKLLVPHLVRTLHNQPVVTFEKDSDSVNELLQFARDILQRGFSPTDESMSVIIDGVLLIILAQGATRLIQNDRLSSLNSVGSDDALHKLVAYICDAEKHAHLKESKGSNSRADSGTLPGWIEVSKSGRQELDDMSHSDMLLNSDQFKLFHMSLCDILGEILLRGGPSQDLPVLLSINSLFDTKRRMNATMTTPSSRLSMENLSYNSLCSLFGLSSFHMRSLLSLSANSKNKSALVEVDIMLTNIIDACQVILSSRFSQEVLNSSQILSSFWALYCSLSDDESSQLLTSFIKESYVGIGGWADEGTYDISETSYSLLSITSSDDLDYHVRHLRGIFLETLAQLLTSTPPSRSSNLEERMASLNILFQLLPHICQDLDAGFLGSSGGLSKRLVLLFLNVIDNCIDHMALLFDMLPSATQHEIRGSFVSIRQAGAIVWGIFRDNSLQQASVVRGALKLCLDKMPRFVQTIERAVNAQLVENEPVNSYTCELLTQCIAGLLSFQVDKDGDKTKLITGSDSSISAQMQVQQKATVSTVEDRATKSWERNNAQQGDGAGGECREEVPGLKTSSMTTDTLPWMYNCAFAAVTNKWNDSYRIISSNTKLSRQRRQCVKEDMPTALVLQRINDISLLHTSVCRMFEDTEKAGDETREVEPDSPKSTILSEFLSYYGKSNICSCIEKMAMTLTSSIKQIATHIKWSQIKTLPSNLDKVKLHESMICLLGWLSSVKTKQTNHSIITGPLQWYINEKKNFNLSSVGKVSTEGYPIISRLPKVILRLEGLEAEIRKLDFVLAGISSQENDVHSKLLLLLDAMTVTEATSNDTNELEADEDTFRTLVRDCLDIFDTSKTLMKTTGADIIMPGGDSSDEELEGSDVLLGGKRQKERYTPMRKSRRVHLRSRNETVDNWLMMDNDEFGPKPGEKYNADDAFVDLEDFLVEG